MQTDQHDDEDILRPRLVWSNPEEPRASPLVFIGVRDGAHVSVDEIGLQIRDWHARRKRANVLVA
jgi:hypothetical protein